MSDFADVAADIAEQHLAVSLANQHAKQHTISRKFCKDCGVTIPAERLAAIKALRCVDCQGVFEAQSRVRGA